MVPSKVLVTVCETTRRHIPEDISLLIIFSQNFQSSIWTIISKRNFFSLVNSGEQEFCEIFTSI